MPEGKDNLKVLHVVWGLGIGGIETMLVNIANSQLKMGLQVEILSASNVIDSSLLSTLDPAIKVHAANINGARNFPAFMFRFNQVIAQVKPSIIHLHASRLSPFIWSKKMLRRAVVTVHDIPTGIGPRHGIMKLVERVFPYINSTPVCGTTGGADRVSRVFAISDAVKTRLKDNFNIESRTINNGILPHLFKKKENFNLGSPFRLLLISRLETHKKGHDLLLQALAKLGPDYVVDFMGSGSSLDELKQLTAGLGLEDRARFLGKCSPEYVRGHLADYDLLVQPSRIEGFGLTVAEAIAAQVPVLVSSGQGPEEVICGEKYGWVFRNGDIDALAEKIRYVRDHYAEAVAKNAQALSHVHQEYSVEVTAKRYVDEYVDLLNSLSR